MKLATHYSGGVKYTLARGNVISISPGWPACVSGVRAEKIRADGRQTLERDRVTCPQCRNRMAREKYDWKTFRTRSTSFILALEKLCKKYNVGLVRRGGLSMLLEDGGKFDPNDIDRPAGANMNPNIPEKCNGCGKPLLLENLYVDDGCPCNVPRGVNFSPSPCVLCSMDCVKPGHRLPALFGIKVEAEKYAAIADAEETRLRAFRDANDDDYAAAMMSGEAAAIARMIRAL